MKIVEVNDQTIPFTGERFTPETAGSIALEHFHRYAFARHACEGKRVLDIACGEGYGSNLLADVAESVIGVDISDEAVAHASLRYQRTNLAFVRGDCAAIPLPDHSVDVVVSFETIEHHDRQQEMLKEIKRVLVPRGLLVVSSPDRHEYSEVPGTRNPFHVKELDRAELDSLLRRNFKKLQFYGQRVVFGSAIVAESSATLLESASLSDGVEHASKGLRRPLYFLVLATDGTLPRLPGGLLETPLAESEEMRWWIRAVEERDDKLRQQIADNEQLRARLAIAPTVEAASEPVLPVSIATLYGTSDMDGSVFDEAEAAHVSYLADGGLQSLTLRLSPKSPPQKVFRLDIANRICCVDVEAMTVTAGDQVVWRWNPDDERALWSNPGGMIELRSADLAGIRVMCTNDDPQCLLALPEKALEALGSGGALQVQVRASLIAPHGTPGLAEFARALAAELEASRGQLAMLAATADRELALSNQLSEMQRTVEELSDRTSAQVALETTQVRSDLRDAMNRQAVLSDRLADAMSALDVKSAQLHAALQEHLVLQKDLSAARQEIQAAQAELASMGGESQESPVHSPMDVPLGLTTALSAARDVFARTRARAEVFEVQSRDLVRVLAERDVALAQSQTTQSDLLARLQAAEAVLAAERARAAELDSRNRALELGLQETRLRHEHAASALSVERARLAELATQSQQVIAAEQARSAEQRAAAAQERARLEAHVAELEIAHESLRLRLEGEVAAVRQQGQADAQRFAADAAAQRVTVERLERETAELRQALDAFRASRSWRITAPLRAVSGAVRSGGALAPLRAVASKTMRRVYRGLPMSFESKRRIKDWVFRNMPGPFESTAAYRQWKAFTAETLALRTMRFDPPPAVPSREAGAATLDPQYDMAMATAVPQAHAPSHATPVVPAPAPMASHDASSLPMLPPADGRWEWVDYVAVSEHVQRGLQEQRSAATIEPIEILDFQATQLDARIAELWFPPASAPKVTLLIPTYGNLKYTVECLSSIAVAGAKVSFEVLVADDASPDGTAERLAGVPNLRVLRHAQNVHFLRNVNRALPQVRGEYCLLLNNDVQVTAGWLDALVEAAESDPKVGAVGPRIVYPSGHLQEAGCSFRPDCTSDMVGLTQPARLPQFDYARAVDYCSGAALLVRTALFREVGGFSEEFAPAYCEDSDLCLKLRAAGYRVLYEPRSTIVHHLSKTTAAQDSAAKLALIGRNLDRFARKWQSTIDTLSDVRLICFYLPQFHTIPENDRWWGQGFTEWRNVAKAKPNFAGHYQPRLPADLGYYDLRVAEVMDQQAELARRYGIGGFCYYYYWFAGKRLLEMPLERMIQTGKPDLPFCLCWANENWTRRWDGQDQEVLMAQAHSDQDDEAVILDLIRYMRLQHYIRIDGRPLLVVYRVSLFPDFARTARTWRRICREQGLGEIYLAMVESFEMVFKPTHPSVYGCDAAVEFPPQGMAEVRQPSGPVVNPSFKGQVGDYRELAVRYCLRPHVPYTRFRGIMPGWDNTARRQDNSFAFEHATPGAFQAWAEHIIDQTRTMRSGDERIVFVNAWNEWAEGAYLEPDRRYGHTFLEAVKNARDAAVLKRRNRYMLG